MATEAVVHGGDQRTAEYQAALGVAMQIAAYWRRLGYEVEARVVWARGVGTVPGSWVVRSDMIDGRPTRRVKPPARPAAASSPAGGHPRSAGR